MNVHLWGPPGSSSLSAHSVPFQDDLFEDLALEPVINTMAGDDPFVKKVCRSVLSAPCCDSAVMEYRQQILKDVLKFPEQARSIYSLCSGSREARKKCWYGGTSPSGLYGTAVHLLSLDLKVLVQIQSVGRTFQSAPMKALFSYLDKMLSDEFFTQARSLEKDISLSDEILVGACFGPCLEASDYTLLQQDRGISKLRWLTAPGFTLAEQDTSGGSDLAARRNQAFCKPADILAEAAEGTEDFLQELQKELAFYIGALNLREYLERMKIPVCFPQADSGQRVWIDLRDLSLLLLSDKPVTGNTLQISGAGLILITGANGGGKTTFLRSVGQCQLMAQCGLFVCAEKCLLPMRTQIMTHFKREESTGQGMLDQELSRMSRMVEQMIPGAMILFNESFSSTNEREGSEIFRQITQALLELGMELFSVTHLFPYADSFSHLAETCCLRAMRNTNGTRTYRMEPGLPEQTAYGAELYQQIFG